MREKGRVDGCYKNETHHSFETGRIRSATEQVMDTSKKSFRIAVVLSVIWELCLLAIAAENSSPSPFDDVYSLQTHIFITYMAIGSLPLVLLWGWKWIRTGR
jgi:hypothetical protein